MMDHENLESSDQLQEGEPTIEGLKKELEKEKQISAELRKWFGEER